MHYHIPVQLGSKILECPHSCIFRMWSGVHPPNENFPRLKDFGFELVWSKSPPPENENLARLRDLRFELVWSNPPSLKRGTFDLSWSGVPHKDLCGSWSETNCCIFQGYRLIRLVDRILSIGWKYSFYVHKVSICYGLHWQVMGAKRSPTQPSM